MASSIKIQDRFNPILSKFIDNLILRENCIEQKLPKNATISDLSYFYNNLRNPTLSQTRIYKDSYMIKNGLVSKIKSENPIIEDNAINKALARVHVSCDDRSVKGKINKHWHFRFGMKLFKWKSEEYLQDKESNFERLFKDYSFSIALDFSLNYSFLEINNYQPEKNIIETCYTFYNHLLIPRRKARNINLKSFYKYGLIQKIMNEDFFLLPKHLTNKYKVFSIEKELNKFDEHKFRLILFNKLIKQSSISGWYGHIQGNDLSTIMDNIKLVKKVTKKIKTQNRLIFMRSINKKYINSPDVGKTTLRMELIEFYPELNITMNEICTTVSHSLSGKILHIQKLTIYRRDGKVLDYSRSVLTNDNKKADVKIEDKIKPNRFMLIGYKKVKINLCEPEEKAIDGIITLELDGSHIVAYQGLEGKCRANRARVIRIQAIDYPAEFGGLAKLSEKLYSTALSLHDDKFIYKEGEWATVERFDETSIKGVCTAGIHFFLSANLACTYGNKNLTIPYVVEDPLPSLRDLTFSESEGTELDLLNFKKYIEEVGDVKSLTSLAPFSSLTIRKVIADELSESGKDKESYDTQKIGSDDNLNTKNENVIMNIDESEYFEVIEDNFEEELKNIEELKLKAKLLKSKKTNTVIVFDEQPESTKIINVLLDNEDLPKSFGWVNYLKKKYTNEF
tara:strand:+ start:4919 stop:6955 length:2037 start_codon:yes stop_codon:yes gene_type:complete